ncbi:LacI family DNA-binding transcriptional regulator [Ornithinibacillus bavariensis]|uniref:Catabolite control protein A n=1 Tax=Ornithinibacillus bavariensis TaxID=545502 RepID=A0A919X5W0_9BACI|nr:LacI family DNA-binding transcriptional regulator [Ornithinibacillus bavariensis]GIO25589.1 LacI family transcriptional regulator [Ornithinibacillus bavariensis]
MPTIKDVAKMAGVSVATVSRVINNSGYVNEVTKKRVEQAISQLNYRPNNVARSLFHGRSQMIALLVPDIMNPFFPELARAVEDFAKLNDYTFVLCNTDDNPEKEMHYIYALEQKSVDGIIVVSSTVTEKSLQGIHVPIVALDRIVSAKLPSITVKNRDGARQAVRYLKQLGCKRIAHICGPDNVSNTKERLGGYIDEVKNEEWFLSSYVVSGDYQYDKAMDATKNLLKSHPEVDGIFVANDLMGVGVLKAAQELGLKVPEDIQIIGFDGISLGEKITPSITTMKQPIYEMGTRAAQLLIQQINEPNQQVQHEEYEVTLVKRESTK